MHTLGPAPVPEIGLKSARVRTTQKPPKMAPITKPRPESSAWPRQDILDAVQQANVFADSKHFVDMPLRTSCSKAILNFSDVANASLSYEALSDYVSANHWEPGSDLMPCTPPDFEPVPENFLPELQQPQLREWALKVHSLWITLCRKVVDDVKEKPANHTLLPLPNVVFIPGDRFRETYYWDSYWIIRGLLASGMPQSASSLVMNLCSLLDTYGFIPNGARSYYLNRSQPPLLSAMVRDVYAAAPSIDLLRIAFPLLIREHMFFTTGSKAVTMRLADGTEHTLSRYYADWFQPRPESYREDLELAHGLSRKEAAQLYCDIASAAESGWDFSSRWFADGHSMATIRTTRIVPADLNAFLVGMEDDISRIAAALGDDFAAEEFARAAARRREAIMACLWDDAAGHWCDVVLNEQQGDDDDLDSVWVGWERAVKPVASNWVPLAYSVCEAGGAQAQAAVASFLRSGLLGPAGVATSTQATGQQWDAPNAWPPLQHLLVEGLQRSGVDGASELAADLARRWVATCFLAFQATGQMHEKYNAMVMGGVGGGGEYVPQTGFGWSNGVVLDFLARFGAACNELEPSKMRPSSH